MSAIRTSHGETEGHLYAPGNPGPHPGMVVCLGVVPFTIDHPHVPRLGLALARAGFAALMYWSPAMRDLRLDPVDVPGLARAYAWLIARPDIDPARSGPLGTCVGGSFALLAAAHPDIRDNVAFVAAWAPYASMRTLTRDVASASTREDGVPVPWVVDQLTRKVFVRSLTATLSPPEADALRRACAEREGALDVTAFSADAQSVYPLLTALDPDGSGAAVDARPGSIQSRLAAMSPIEVVNDIRAPLIALPHDRDDAVIPIGESRRLRNAFGAREGVRYTEFSMFRHLDPSKASLSRLALARELMTFFGAVSPLMRIATRDLSFRPGRRLLCRACEGERSRRLPGDDLVDDPLRTITHAIMIDAAPRDVWPWIVQMGSGRAGWYAFDRIDSGGVPSARRIVPEFQEVAVGDVLPWLPGARDGFVVAGVVPEQALALVVPRGAGATVDAPPSTGVERPRASWVLALESRGEGAGSRTRLISRARISRDWLTPPEGAKVAPSGPEHMIERVYDLLSRLPTPVMLGLAEGGHAVMESRMLRGIRRRAEWHAHPARSRPGAGPAPGRAPR